MSWLHFIVHVCFQLCRTFNKICQRKLNKGFTKVDQLHARISKSVKCQLPRRESERRNHPLARHVDILSAVETRLSLLGMSYLKYIDMGLCCFIPGKVRCWLKGHMSCHMWFSTMWHFDKGRLR